MSETHVVSYERDVKGRFLTGAKAGPGRPVGSRNRHATNLLTAFADDFERFGADIIAKVREEQPATYLKLAVDLLPRDVAIDLAIDHRVQIEAVLADFRGLNIPDKSVEKLMRLASRSKVIDADDT
jgi:hypothetical protein